MTTWSGKGAWGVDGSQRSGFQLPQLLLQIPARDWPFGFLRLMAPPFGLWHTRVGLSSGSGLHTLGSHPPISSSNLTSKFSGAYLIKKRLNLHEIKLFFSLPCLQNLYLGSGQLAWLLQLKNLYTHHPDLTSLRSHSFPLFPIYLASIWVV